MSIKKRSIMGLIKIYGYIKSDYCRYGKKVSLYNILRALIIGNHCFKFSFWLRLCSQKNIFLYPAYIMYKYYRNKYGIQISRHTQIGYGLNIGHGIGIIVNSTAIIGNNVNISQFTTIGANEGEAAVIGNNVYIGPSVCIIENLNIGNNVTIGAGSVITKNIADNATVAGVPAKILSYNNPGRYIKHPWSI